MPNDDGYEYAIKAKDEMSQPVERARDALGRFVKVLDETDSAERKVAKSAKAAIAAFADQEKSVKSAHSAHSGFASGLSYLIRGTDDLARGSSYAAAGLKDLAMGLGRVGIFAAGGLAAAAIGKMAYDAGEFREQTTLAYEVVTGTAEEGERTFQQLDKTAREIHMPAERAHDLAKTLMLEGLESQRSITETVRAIGDLQRVGLEAGAGKLQAIVERSVAAGHFDIGKGARGLKGTGVTMDAIAAELHLGRKQFEAELKAGQISTEAGIQAIDDAVTKGKVGALATKKFTVSDALTDMKNSLKSVLQTTDTGPLTDAFRRLSESFTEGSQGAADLKDTLDGLMSLGGSIVDLTSAIGSGLAGAFRLVKEAIDLAKHAGEGLLYILREDANAFKIFQSKEDKDYQKAQQAEVDKRIDKELRMRIERAKLDEINKAQGKDLTPTQIHQLGKKLNVDLYAPGKEEPGGKSEITDEKALREAIKHATGPITVGPLSPAAAFEASARDAGDAQVEGFRKAHGAHSPSTEFFDLGKDDADGYALGLQSGGMGQSATMPAQVKGGGKGGLTVHVDVGGIHMTGHVDHDEFMPLLESQIADVFERAALELGQ